MKVVVDFERGEISACVLGSDTTVTEALSLPDRASFTKEVFAIRASSKGSIVIGAIKVYAGEI